MDVTDEPRQKKSLLAAIISRFHQQRDLPISWNIAPTQDVLAIRFNPETKQRSLDALRWGLIPNWAKGPKIAYKTINARAETVDTAPSYRQAFMKRRCLIPVDGFYEWKKVPSGKIPYSISMEDDSPLPSFKTSVFAKTLANLRKCSDTGLKARKLDEPMRAATPKRKATKVIHHPNLPESARFDPINLQKERFGGESERKQRQTESWHSFSTF